MIFGNDGAVSCASDSERGRWLRRPAGREETRKSGKPRPEEESARNIRMAAGSSTPPDKLPGIDAPPPGESAGCWTLDSLPADELLCVLAWVQPSCLIAGVAPACKALHAACEDQALWKHKMLATYSSLLQSSCFGGILPPPPNGSLCGSAWRVHYFSFADTFMQLSYKHRGRLVMQIDSRIIDATDYMDAHPGEPEVLIAAAGSDATEVFASIGHSPNAHRFLSRLVVAPRSELIPAACDAWVQTARRCSGASPRLSSAAAAHEAWSPAKGLARAVLSGLRSTEGRAQLRSALSLSLGALVRDLTEGRPDCRRFAPAVWRLTEVRLQELGRRSEDTLLDTRAGTQWPKTRDACVQ